VLKKEDIIRIIFSVEDGLRKAHGFFSSSQKQEPCP
jgi:hypothetical protein